MIMATVQVLNIGEDRETEIETTHRRRETEIETSPKANVYAIGVLYLRSRGATECISGFRIYSRTIKREILKRLPISNATR